MCPKGADRSVRNCETSDTVNELTLTFRHLTKHLVFPIIEVHHEMVSKLIFTCILFS